MDCILWAALVLVPWVGYGQLDLGLEMVLGSGHGLKAWLWVWGLVLITRPRLMDLDM